MSKVMRSSGRVRLPALIVIGLVGSLVGVRILALAQVLPPLQLADTNVVDPTFAIGPIDGLTSSWYLAPPVTSIPLGTYVQLHQPASPHSIVKWTGVRFSDFADMLGLVPGVHYCRFIASDRFYADEPLSTLRHPQVMLAWLMNDEPIPPRHGAPLRLVIPFRYGNRSVTAITEMTFSTPGPRMPPLPA